MVTKKTRKDKLIIEMKIGESGYVLPWSINIDGKNGDVYLDTNMPVHETEFGTANIYVRRIAENNWDVSVPSHSVMDHAEGNATSDLVKVGNLKFAMLPIMDEGSVDA